MNGTTLYYYIVYIIPYIVYYNIMLPKRQEKEGGGSMQYAIGVKIRRVTPISSMVRVREVVRVRVRV